MILFNKAPYIGNEKKYILKAIKTGKLSGGGYFNNKCENFIEKRYDIKKVMLTPSATAALEMCAILIGIGPGDEVIMPSYTFVSTANAFVLRGAKIVFVDIKADTMNIDEDLIEDAITNKTKAIVVVHYAGVGCEMDKIEKIATEYNLYLIEDAAQGIEAFYKKKALGSIGDLGVFSFHETKNITSGGEGGALLINNEKFIKRAEIIREKGTNRNAFFRGEIAKYTWVHIGSSYLMNEISAAYLWVQLKNIEKITKTRLKIWETYYNNLVDLEQKEYLVLPKIPNKCKHNGHIFYIKTEKRTKLLNFLNKEGINTVFHYIPLHSSIGGNKFGKFKGKDIFTTKESKKLLRLPMHYSMNKQDLYYAIDKIKEFYND